MKWQWGMEVYLKLPNCRDIWIHKIFFKIGDFFDTKISKVKFFNYHWTNTVGRNTSEPEYFVLHFEGRHPLSLSTTTRVSGWTPESTERVKTLRRSATSWYSRQSPLTVITNLQQITSMELLRHTSFSSGLTWKI